MIKTIVDLLEKTTENYKHKIAFSELSNEITYGDFVIESKKVASAIAKFDLNKKPIAIFLDKSIECIYSMIGTVYSGNFYTIIDTKMPQDRINNIMDVLEPEIIITNSKYNEKVKAFANDKKILIVEDVKNVGIDENKLKEIRENIVDTDIMYILFTSGSTGIPKGTVLTHKSVLSYIMWYIETFDINEKTIFGSQTPLYFSMSVSDLFSTMIKGATFCIIPKMYFSFPIKLLEYLNEKRINTIYWVPSALCIVANLKALDEVELPYIEKVLFAGEVMPMKQLNIWREHLKKTMFANLFGPTETVDICTYYVVDRKFKNDEMLPIGKACDNCGILLITDENKEAKEGEEGEICARGSFLAQGYYKNLDKTNQVFVQNPLNDAYKETIYKTGDLAKYNEYGELVYISRKDFQIKHMGYRIELGEIENAVNAVENITTCACVYDEKKQNIVLFYVGNVDNNTVLEGVKKKVPVYMVPNRIIKLDKMQYNANGKIDRKYLKTLV